MFRIRRPMLIWCAVAALCLGAGLLGAWLLQHRPSGELVQVPAFGDNPTQLEMHVYVPPRLAHRPAVLLALHWCQGSGPEFFTHTRYAQLADQHGFVVIYPSVTRASRCWDVHSAAAMTHGGGSDPRGLLSMIDHVLDHQQADPARVFVTGHSSGGMMTQLLLAAYPDVFRAGASWAGVPFGCFAGASEWSEPCARGEIAQSPEEWSALVKEASPGFEGARPRVQLWHGTADEVIDFHNFGESLKQWSRVLDADIAPPTVREGTPGSGWTRYQYANARGEVQLEAFRGADQPHNMQIDADTVIEFFDLGR